MSIVENEGLFNKTSKAKARKNDASGKRSVKEKNSHQLHDIRSEAEYGYYAELANVSDMEGFKQRITVIINRLGFSDFSFIRLEMPGGVYRALMKSLPTGLLDSCYEPERDESDMVGSCAQEQQKPVYTSTFYDYVGQAPVDMGVMQAIKETQRLNASFGYFDYYNIPIVSRNGKDQVMFSVTQRGLSPVDFKLKVKGCETTLQMLAEAIDFVITQKFPQLLIGTEEHDVININRGPLRVLDALANNDMKIGQVANKLCISIVTATKHLEAARKILGVRTNHAAIKKAILSGLIEYDK